MKIILQHKNLAVTHIFEAQALMFETDNNIISANAQVIYLSDRNDRDLLLSDVKISDGKPTIPVVKVFYNSDLYSVIISETKTKD